MTTERDRSELLRHPESRYHLAGKIGRLLNVIRCAGGCITKHKLLRNVSTEHRGDLVFKLALALQVAVFCWQVHRVTERHATADDRHLADRIALLKDASNHRMATFVIRDDLLLWLGDEAALPLWASHNAIQRLGKLIHANHALTAARSKDCRFVHEVRKVSARESWRTTSDLFKVHRLVERLPLHMHLQDGESTLQVRAIKDHLTIKSTRA